jgi:CheY-like chemotaxis protein
VLVFKIGVLEINRMKKILIVDDVKLLREIHKRYLSSSHVEVLTAENGEEALDITRRERPDLIIMDRYMPRMDGLACCIAIKADPSIAHIPVIMATNAAQKDDADEYIRSGASDYLSKPIEAKIFLEMIRKYLPEIDRRASRVSETIKMKIVADNSQSIAVTGDMSLNGAFAVTDMNVSVNEELKFSFMLPGKDVPIEIQGRVVWLKKEGDASGFGVEFIRVTGPGLPMLRSSELKDFVQSKIKD